jgi:hypothetical protein
MLTLVLILFLSTTAQAGEGLVSLPHPTQRPLFRVAHVTKGESLLKLDDDAFHRLVHGSKEGDVFTIPLPDSEADAKLSVHHRSLDPKKDLDCCSIILGNPDGTDDGTATLPLTHQFTLRDFTIRHLGRTYQFRASGSGNFVVTPKN